MKKRQKIGIGTCVAAILILACDASQSSRPSSSPLDAAFFEKQILAFEAADAEAMPPAGVIVFAGSSSIRMWKTLSRDMAPLPVVNRGFGGSHLAHLVYNARRIITPYRPSKVLVYAGDNDLAKGSPKTAEVVLHDYQKLVALIHADVPDSEILFLAIKPSLARWDRWPEMERANSLIARFCDSDPKLVYVDVASPLIANDGEPRDDVFLGDGLHLNATGYAAWTRVVRAQLFGTEGN